MLPCLLSASKYVTISVVKPILHRLTTVELACEEYDLPLTCDLKNEILQRLKTRYEKSDLSNMLVVVIFLDARYKADFITTEPTTGTTDEAEDATQVIQSQLHVVKEELLKQAVFLSVLGLESTPSPSPSTEPTKEEVET
ncbi:Hypothetical predicted protein [Paramuricea clavata]|uniref:Uncharacterized protein n=1 Tax=Paramuricea clavata TaxID=317549 RepID=A0A7D9I4M3_PARCT|nr:Hypothetical predicted protein [Paramuricea clavata]